jgi:Transcriptional regulators
MSSPVTLSGIARRVGLSTAAVSYALRGSGKVSPEVAARVRAMAEKLGYRPNPRIGELMAQIRAGRAVSRGDVLALVCLEGRRSAPDDFLQHVLEGAKRRAAMHGFGVEIFWLAEVEGSVSRLVSILRARGVAGVVFAPVNQTTKVELDWPWDMFPFAVIGMAEWGQPVPRAGHHHFEAMRRVLRYFDEIGVRRPACWLNEMNDERAHRGWSAAWLASRMRGASRRLRLARGSESKKEIAAWLKQMDPDALVVAHAGELEMLRSAGWRAGEERTVLLNWRPGCGACGIEQSYDEIAGSVVDLVLAQLHHNTRGLPEIPSMLLFPGRWRSGSTA